MKPLKLESTTGRVSPIHFTCKRQDGHAAYRLLRPHTLYIDANPDTSVINAFSSQTVLHWLLKEKFELLRLFKGLKGTVTILLQDCDCQLPARQLCPLGSQQLCPADHRPRSRSSLRQLCLPDYLPAGWHCWYQHLLPTHRHPDGGSFQWHLWPHRQVFLPILAGTALCCAIQIVSASQHDTKS